jgi:hypothetical protein
MFGGQMGLELLYLLVRVASSSVVCVCKLIATEDEGMNPLFQWRY